MPETVNQFLVTLSKVDYFPGEVVEGTLHLTTTADISCRGIRVELNGKSFCAFDAGSDNDRCENRMYYARERLWIWGKRRKTVTIDGAGSNAMFNPPWAPCEGRLILELPRNGPQQVIVRVMDDDWGKKDDLLGETVINVSTELPEGIIQTAALSLMGRPDKGQLKYTMQWGTASEASKSANTATLELLIISATGLRKADFIGRNDVYVEAYVPPSFISSMDSALPKPEKRNVLPPSKMEIPFRFVLPIDLPSSFECSRKAYIRYSIYACIDIKWKLDYSTRTFFTVVQPIVPYTDDMRPSPLSNCYSKKVYPICCIPPFCCCFFDVPIYSFGGISLQVVGNRDGFVPGELVPLSIKASNDTSRNCQVVVELVRHHLMRAEGYSKRFHERFPMGLIDLPAKSHMDSSFSFPIPLVPPVFLRDPLAITGWLAQNPRGGTNRYQYAEPIVWFYELCVQLKVPSGKDIKFAFPVTIGALHKVQIPPEPMPVITASENPNAWEQDAPPFPTQLPLWSDHVSVPEIRNQPLHWSPSTMQEAQDPKEDINSYAPTLSYAPAYLTIPTSEEAKTNSTLQSNV